MDIVVVSASIIVLICKLTYLSGGMNRKDKMFFK